MHNGIWQYAIFKQLDLSFLMASGLFFFLFFIGSTGGKDPVSSEMAQNFNESRR